MGATVPQDRIFTLSALTTDDLELDFNYEKPLHDYLEAIIKTRCLRRGLQLEPLNLKICAWASGSPSWVAESHRGFLLKLLASINFNFLRLDHDISILEDFKTWPQDFRACGEGPFAISEANFPKPQVLKLQCHLLGQVNGAQRLEPTEEEEKLNEAILKEAAKHTEPRYFSSMVASSWLAAVSALQKMKTFLGGSISTSSQSPASPTLHYHQARQHMASAPRIRGPPPQPPEAHTGQGIESTSDTASETGKAGRPVLLSFDEMPEWFRRENNHWILHGYRPISGSVQVSFGSWSYLHNESVNIYSHLIPAVFFLLAEWYLQQYLTRRYPGVTGADFMAFSIYMLTAVTCLSLSATYHTLYTIPNTWNISACGWTY